MAKVYSWEVKRNPRTYAYIIHPDSVTYVSDKAVSTTDPKAYIGSELKGTRLQKVIDWVQNPENDYETQFQIMVNTCANDERAQNAVFDTASSYIDLPGTCDLRGPAGRGIESVRYSHSLNGESVYIIKYDDGAEDSFSVRDGKDGKDGIDGTPGAKGDAGVSSKFMMVYTTGKNDAGELITPERPEGGSYDFLTGKASYPEGWAPNDSGVIPPVWMSSRTFTTSELSTDPEWSVPVQITGENGAPGVDGVSTEFIYKRTKIKPTEVGQLPSVNENGYVPTDWGWTGSPLGVTEDDPTEWCCLRKMVKDVGWGSWDGPTIWSQYGVNGQDGDGVQYIYMRNKGELPKNPTPFGWDDPKSEYQNKRLEWVPAIGSYINHTGASVTITEEYYWSDNPQDVDTTYQYQWVAVRKYRKGDNGEQMWQPFSNPTLWGKFGENGDNGTSVRTLYALSTSTSDYPTPPTGTTATGDWGSGFPKDYEFGKNVVWGITAEIWSHNNEFVDPETGWSKPFLVTGVKGKDGDAINYNSRYFAYGWVDSTPYPLSSTDPDNPGKSLDGKGRTVKWQDYPDTKNIGSDNDERRWYQCDVHINGDTQKIEKYGPVLPCNGRDGSATPGKYTEFRFAVTPTEDEPILVQFNDDGQIIREPKLFNKEHTEQWGWFTSDKELPELKSGGAVWEIWATIDGATEEVIIQSDASGWSGPLRVSGERGQQGIRGPAGLRGVTGIPGAMINPMYCLGTKGRQEMGESFFENGDGYFGTNLWKDDVLPEELTGWYKTPPYSDFLDATSTDKVNDYASISNNIGRVVRYITTKENSGVTEVYYTYYLIEDLYTIKEIKKDVLQQDELYIYIWCTQGKDIWKAGTVGEEEEGDTVKHERIGVDWCDPFRLQGTNGLRGLAGNRGQVVYPMGIYNEEEVYITTDAKAPYVYDPDDGLFYVYNVVGKPWVGKLPTDYRNIKIDKNGNADDGAEYYKYSIDGTYGNWIVAQNGDTPGNNFANHTNKGSTPAWERFESFQALYTSIGIIANGMIGSAVYNNEFMFSQQGLKADGKTFSTDYEKFLEGYKYDEKGKTENGETKHWYYSGTTNYISDRDVNPYETKSTIDSTCIHGFQPNVCINFKTGEMWLSGGKVNFDATGAGYLANQYINWTSDGTVIIGKPGESDNGIIINSSGITIGPLEGYKIEMDGTIKSINQSISGLSQDLQDLTDSVNENIEDLQEQLKKDLAALQTQVDKKAETYYQADDPSTGWTDTVVKSEHVGDMWYNTTNHVTYRWNGEKWEEQEIPSSVFDMIDGKSAIYVAKPTSDNDGDGYLYRVNDMWLLESDYTGTTQLGASGKKGSIWVATASTVFDSAKENNGFKWADWIKKGTELDNWIAKEFADEINAIRTQVDGKANTHYGPDDPSTEWSADTTDKNKLASEHVGDLWFNTTVSKSYTYTDNISNAIAYEKANPSEYYWVESNVPQDIFDKIDGKSQVFVKTPTIPWYEGDLWLKEGEIYRAICDRETGTVTDEILKTDWIKACYYTNDDTALKAIGRLNAIANDNYVSPDEQRQLANELTAIKNEYTSLNDSCQKYKLNVSTSTYYTTYQNYNTGYNRAVSALTYYTTASNRIIDENSDYYLHINIPSGYTGTGTTAKHYGNIAAYYGVKQDLQNALVSAAEDKAISGATAAKNELAKQIGYDSYDDMVNTVKTNGKIIQQGGYLNANLIKSDWVETVVLSAQTATVNSLKADTAWVKDLTVSKMNTKPSENGTKGKILIEGNEINVYSNETDFNEVLKVSGTKMESVESDKTYSTTSGSLFKGSIQGRDGDNVRTTTTVLGRFTTGNEYSDYRIYMTSPYPLASFEFSYDVTKAQQSNYYVGVAVNITIRLRDVSLGELQHDSIASYYETHNFQYGDDNIQDDPNGYLQNPGGDFIMPDNDGVIIRRNTTYEIVAVTTVTNEGDCIIDGNAYYRGVFLDDSINLGYGPSYNRLDIANNGIRYTVDNTNTFECVKNTNNFYLNFRSGKNGINISTNGITITYRGNQYEPNISGSNLTWTVKND